MTIKVANTVKEIPDAMVEGKPTLVYWNIAGLALPIRLMLIHAEVDFADIRIEQANWFEAKHGKLSEIMEFPNLPYFLDGDVRISQTNTILRHVARKYGMESPQPHISDVCCDHLTDLEHRLARLSYDQSPEAVLKWYQEDVPGLLAGFSRLLKKSGSQFLTGDNPMLDDFKLYAFLYKMRVIHDDLVKDETKEAVTEDLAAFMKGVEALPRVKEYLASTNHLARPINALFAKWVGA